MTAPARTVERKRQCRAAWRPAFLRSAPLRIAVIAICALWSIPTLGLSGHLGPQPGRYHHDGLVDALLNPFKQGQWTLGELRHGLGSEGMITAFLNSLIVTIPSTVIPITIAAFAAYAFAWIKFPGRGILFAIVVGLLVVPLQMSLIPVLQLYSDRPGLYGTFLGIWLAHTAFGLPLAIFLLYNFISQLPRDLFESAAIDGASHFQTFITHRPAAVRAGARRLRDLPVPVGLERPAGGAGVPGRRARTCGSCRPRCTRWSAVAVSSGTS